MQHVPPAIISPSHGVCDSHSAIMSKAVSCNLLFLSLVVGLFLGDAAGRLGCGEDVRLGAL